MAARLLTNPQALAVVAAAPVFGLGLLTRSSPWVLPLDIAAAAGLFVLGASLARGGSVTDLSVPAFVARAVHAGLHGLFAPAFVARLIPRRVGTSTAVLRGAGLALPLILVLGLLLSSADAVFASFVRLPPEDALLHGVLLAIGAWGMAGLLRLASAKPMLAPAAPGPRLGVTEATVVLGSLVALYATFVAAQVYAASEGGRKVIDTAGLTYAEYARSGFFQLLWVAAITLAALMALRGAVDLSDTAVRRRLLTLAELAVMLTLAIVAVAIRRLLLYEDVFGLTMLRLYSTVFAVWVGAVFVLLGCSLAGLGRGRQWLAPAAVAVGLGVVLALNVVNPEAAVVRHNVDHALETGRFDPAYLGELSDDAVPALADALPRLPPDARAAVVEVICTGPRRAAGGFWAYNASVDAAIEARNRTCP